MIYLDSLRFPLHGMWTSEKSRDLRRSHTLTFQKIHFGSRKASSRKKRKMPCQSNLKEVVGSRDTLTFKEKQHDPPDFLMVGSGCLICLQCPSFHTHHRLSPSSKRSSVDLGTDAISLRSLGSLNGWMWLMQKTYLSVGCIWYESIQSTNGRW